MVVFRKTAAIFVFTLMCAPAIAQDEAELAQEARQAEARLMAQEAAVEAQVARQDSRRAEVDVRMRDAEQRLAEAARRVADLSMAQLPRMERMERIIQANRGPVLGVTIGGEDEGGPVEGVNILGVSPGGAAEESGLRAGDVITSINDESLTANNSQEANSRLLDFMQGVEEGDELKIEYLRDGKSATTELTPRPIDHNMFAFDFGGGNFTMPDVHAPGVRQFGNFIWHSDGHGFGDMELAPLTERLGSYFGTDEGLLVVRAPEDEALQLEDGDVILNIDGREPSSVAHAMRILGSYESGEALKIEIMRDKRKRTITLEIPDNRQSNDRSAIAAPVDVKIREKIVVVDDQL
jgi:C-terminal processing protease CtpA/Prc